MSRALQNKLARAVAVAAGVLALAGCADTNRAGTLNQETSGGAVAQTLERQMAIKDLQNAHVTCAKTMVVNAGATETCHVTVGGVTKVVQFTFKSYSPNSGVRAVKVS